VRCIHGHADANLMYGSGRAVWRYSEVGQTVIAAASDNVSYVGEAFLGSAHLFVGQPVSLVSRRWGLTARIARIFADLRIGAREAGLIAAWNENYGAELSSLEIEQIYLPA
jgi:hypothetical protein